MKRPKASPGDERKKKMSRGKNSVTGCDNMWYFNMTGGRTYGRTEGWFFFLFHISGEGLRIIRDNIQARQKKKITEEGWGGGLAFSYIYISLFLFFIWSSLLLQRSGISERTAFSFFISFIPTSPTSDFIPHTRMIGGGGGGGGGFLGSPWGEGGFE